MSWYDYRGYLSALAALMWAAPALGQESSGAPAFPEPAAASAPAVPPDDRDRQIEELRRAIAELQRRLEELEKRPSPEPPPAPPAAPARPAATLLPNISAIGNLQFRGGDSGFTPNRGRFSFSELEIAFQDAVAPKLRYDVFVSAAKEEEWSVGMEEGYLTATALAKGLSARLGRIRTPVGKFNALHPHQWRTITQPLASGAFLGPEGLVSDGAVLQYLLPVRGIFANLELGRWETTSEVEDGLGLGAGENGAWSGRLWLGREIGRDRELEVGLSRYWGKGDVPGFGRKKRAVSGVDLTYRSFPGNYRRLWLTAELLAHETRGVAGDTRLRPGAFGLAAYRWNRYWEGGLRGDYTRFPFPLDGSAYGGSLFLTRYLTEQTSLRLEYQYTQTPDFGASNGIYFQLLFGSGPHSHVLQ